MELGFCALTSLCLAGPKSNLWRNWETSKARGRLSPVCQLFVRAGCCLSAFWSEDRQGGVRVWMPHVAVLVLGLLTQAGEVGPCGVVTGGREELREMFLFFWLSIWRRDGKLPQISDTVTKVSTLPPLAGRSPGELYLSVRDEWAPVRLCGVPSVGKCCARNQSCSCEEGT